jgi:hypothetical protein
VQARNTKHIEATTMPYQYFLDVVFIWILSSLVCGLPSRGKTSRLRWDG